jgi:cytochrome c
MIISVKEMVMKYQYNTLATAKTEWTTSTGLKIVAGYKLVEETRDLLDMDKYTRSNLSCQLFATVNGAEEHATSVEMLANRPDNLIAKIGRIGLNATQLAAVRATRTEIESHPEWVAKMAAREAGEKVRREYDAYQHRLDNMMTLNGRIY